MVCVCCWYIGFSMFKGLEFFVNIDFYICLFYKGIISEWVIIGRKGIILFGFMKWF